MFQLASTVDHRKRRSASKHPLMDKLKPILMKCDVQVGIHDLKLNESVPNTGISAIKNKNLLAVLIMFAFSIDISRVAIV